MNTSGHDQISEEETKSLLLEDNSAAGETKALTGSDIGILSKSHLSFFIEMYCIFPAQNSLVIYVQADESLVVWNCVHPIAKQLAGDKQIILLNQDSPLPEIDPLHQFALICLNAEATSPEFLKNLIRGETPLSNILNSDTIHSLFYLHGIHRCTEKIHPHVLDLVDLKRNRACSRVVISGIHGHPNNLNAVTPNITSRCSVFALE